MSRLATLKALKKLVLPGVFAAAVAALMGIHSTELSAQGGSQLWSVVAHFRYENGFEYDYVVERGVPTETLTSMLAYCGSAHRMGFAGIYYCYPVPE